MSAKSTTEVLLFKTWYLDHTGWSHFHTDQSTTKNPLLIQNDVKFQWSVFIFFEQRFPRICINKVLIFSVQHFILSIHDYRHIVFQWFPHFPNIMPIVHGQSFGVTRWTGRGILLCVWLFQRMANCLWCFLVGALLIY